MLGVDVAGVIEMVGEGSIQGIPRSVFLRKVALLGDPGELFMKRIPHSRLRSPLLFFPTGLNTRQQLLGQERTSPGGIRGE